MNSTQATVEAILSERFGGKVTVARQSSLTDPDRPSQVSRYLVVDGPEGAPPSVIVKVSGGRHPRFLNDWAGAAFLSRLPDAVPAASFYGSDRHQGLLLLEDLGDHGGLDKLLTGTDPAAAEAGLAQMAEAFGGIQAATAGQEAAYRELRGSLGPWRQLRPESLLDWFRAAGPWHDSRLSNQQRWFQWRSSASLRKAGVKPGPGFSRVGQSLLRRLGSGPLVAYNQGDPCPDNWRLTPSGPRLIDFEAGGMRSGLMDGAYFRMHFPTCWCAGRIPAPVVARLEQLYRATFAAGCPAVLDEQTWRSGMADACAFWAWFTVASRLPEALEDDSRWGIATVRPRILARLAAFLEAAEGQAALDDLRRPADALLTELTRRWGDADLPLYPCFSEA